MPTANTIRNKARRIAKEKARQPRPKAPLDAHETLRAEQRKATCPEFTEPKAPRNHLFKAHCDNNTMRQQLLEADLDVPKFKVTYTPKPRAKRKTKHFETMGQMRDHFESLKVQKYLENNG